METSLDATSGDFELESSEEGGFRTTADEEIFSGFKSKTDEDVRGLLSTADFGTDCEGTPSLSDIPVDGSFLWSSLDTFNSTPFALDVMAVLCGTDAGGEDHHVWKDLTGVPELDSDEVDADAEDSGENVTGLYVFKGLPLFLPNGDQIVAFVVDCCVFETASLPFSMEPVELLLSSGEPEHDISILLCLFLSFLLETLTDDKQEVEVDLRLLLEY